MMIGIGDGKAEETGLRRFTPGLKPEIGRRFYLDTGKGRVIDGVITNVDKSVDGAGIETLTITVKQHPDPLGGF